MKWYSVRPHVVLFTVFIVFWLSNPLIALFDYGKPMEVNLSPPAIIVYKSDMFKGATAASKGTVIYIKPEDKGNLPLLHHELTHCKQFWLSCGMSVFLYHYSDKFRLLYELEAFREGLKYEPDRKGARIEYALLLTTEYKLDKLIDFEIAYLLLGDK